MWQLLVHSDEDLRDFAGDAVRAACLAAARTTRPIKAGNLAEALQNLEDWRIADCDLVIIEATAPATRKASIGGAAREPVFEFIRRLKTERSSLPVIVLSPSPDELLRIFLTAYDATAHVELLPGWREELQQRAKSCC